MFPETIEIEVTAKALRKYDYSSSKKCPIAMTLRDLGYEPTVFGSRLFVIKNNKKVYYLIPPAEGGQVAKIATSFFLKHRNRKSIKMTLKREHEYYER